MREFLLNLISWTTFQSLNDVFDKAKIVEFDDSSKFIFFSDCHRGTNNWADDFSHNKKVFFHALKHYYDRGFTYIEIGDGDELWENKSFEDIRKAHANVYRLMSKLYEEDRLFLIWGNHNRQWKNPKNWGKNLYRYYDERGGELKLLFDDIKVHEGLVLSHRDTGNKIFLVHGHQGDPFNDRFWWFGRFIVRNIWKLLQMFVAWKDPTSPAKNFKKRKKVEKEITQWIDRNHGQPLIAGHTHRPVFSGENESPYFNTGSCVHPRSITGIKIEEGEIALVKWFMDVKPEEGTLFINNEVLEGPKKLQDYF